MSREYTEVIEDSYPKFMKEQWMEYTKYLERELRKASVKIAELEKKVENQKPKARLFTQSTKNR